MDGHFVGPMGPFGGLRRPSVGWQISGYLGIWSYLPSGADFWAHSRAILPRAPRQENLLRREAPSVLGPPQAPKYLASETLGAFLHGKSGVPKDISRTTTSRTSTARNIPMPHPGAYVASDRETCVCAFKAFHASTFHSTAGISQNYDSLRRQPPSSLRRPDARAKASPAASSQFWILGYY